ncbi:MULTISPECIES: molybdate ABC transporter substrate-binding protein [unclassified Arthrobacter]|uniref:molybdate ABC transporter substrate-binding protein n=1 Tax=Micrococcaceae TaxID=1268 RepID=UPI000CFC3E63|nr:MULTISPECIES: molybdate ABC transporter substrate-binding protein [unclassified Arthrobacter]PRB74707.1 molybdate ABC transporter substrate-binding protein [Arthrobacter sp. MYb214]TDU18218.1 molybdate transport system substrate-binding protein [Arthrobacter sp. JUb115]
MQHRPFPRFRALAGLAATVLALAGCSASGSSDQAASEPITISAAASLQSAFEQISEEFTAEHPEVQIAGISYDGSSTLATQILEGSNVDVFASADERNMLEVTEAGFGHEPVIFASNTMVIAVPQENPADIDSLEDLAGATTVLCAQQVPCGSASRQLLQAQGVEVVPASEEQNVTAVLQKVAAGEADAGLVYATDVLGDENVAAIVPEGADEVVNTYPIATLGQNPGAQAFVDFVISERGQEILAEHGFGTGAAQANG